jgi:hypothetical protein
MYVVISAAEDAKSCTTTSMCFRSGTLNTMDILVMENLRGMSVGAHSVPLTNLRVRPGLVWQR